jgi:2-phosphoglycerate kinase
MDKWIVLIIGGASGTGKSTAAYEIGRHFGVNILEFDDIHQAVKPMISAECFPAIANLDGCKWMERGVVWNVEWLKAVSRELSLPLVKLVERHVEDNVPIIIEGDFIIPETVKPLLSPRVKALFIQESDKAQIIKNFQAREGGEPQSFRADICVMYNDWVRASCEEHGIAVFEARPWDDVLERAVKLL